MTRLIHRARNHPVLLDRRDAVDALVVGIGVVVRGEQALHLSDAEFLQRFQPKVAIQEKPVPGFFSSAITTGASSDRSP